jgi:integrase
LVKVFFLEVGEQAPEQPSAITRHEPLAGGVEKGWRTIMSATCAPARRTNVERGIYLQPNGNYAVCFMAAGKPRFRTVGCDLEAARVERLVLIAAARRGAIPACPRLRFSTVVERWLARFEAMVAAGERRERTLEAHRYHLEHHLLPAFSRRTVASITVQDVADLLVELRAAGHAPKTVASTLATLHGVLRFALRHDWIVADPVSKLEAYERPRLPRRRQRVLGRDEIARLLACSPDRYRLLIATVLYTGLRISETLGLVWDDVDLEEGAIHVCAQLSRAHRDRPACRVEPKTPAAVREVPLVAQLARLLATNRATSAFPGGGDWVFATGLGTPHSQRNVMARGLTPAADQAGLNDGTWPRLRFHDLRHTFASHLIVDLERDVTLVSRLMGHARVTITLDVYTHLFDEARHRRELRACMAASPFAALLEDEMQHVGGTVTPLVR